MRAIERIEQDIAAVKEAIASLAEELNQTYASYLEALAKAVRQQFIQAAYYICTQGYPDNFLKSSLSEKQNIQQNLQKMTKETEKQLVSFLSLPGELDNPEAVVKWQEELEQNIVQTLHSLSRYANRLLQQAGVLPQHLPEGLLEVAAKADAANEVMPGPPNLLNLLVEAENASESESMPVTKLIAIHLRLSEIEFADSILLGIRNQLRNLSGRANVIRREYQKKQRELTIAQAESAWRSSWYEE